MKLRTMAVGLAAAVALGGAATAQPAAPPPPDAERLALADRIYAIIGPQTLAATRQAIDGMMASTVKATQGPDAAKAEAVRSAMTDALDRMMPRVLQGTVAIMARDFSAEELRGILAFYQAPTGQALLRKMPEVGQQSVRLSLSLMPQMMRDFQAEYCARTTCTAKERDAFAAADARLDAAAAQAAAAPPPP